MLEDVSLGLLARFTDEDDVSFFVRYMGYTHGLSSALDLQYQSN
jgi:hypothetical protein